MFSLFSWFIEISSGDFDSSKQIAGNEENGNWVEPVKSQQFHHMIQFSMNINNEQHIFFYKIYKFHFAKL